MRLDKLSWAEFVREAEKQRTGLFDCLLNHEAAQLEMDKAAVLARLSSLLRNAYSMKSTACSSARLSTTA